MILGWLRRRIAEPAVRERTQKLVEQRDRACSDRDSARSQRDKANESDRRNRKALGEIEDGVAKPIEWGTTMFELNAMWEDLSADERRTALNLFIGWRARKAGVSP